MSEHRPSPVQIARLALIRLSEQGLPPTPENYSQFYYSIAGTPPPAAAPSLAPEVVGRLHEVVEDASETTASLVSLLSGHELSLSQSITQLDSAEEPESMVAILQHLLSSARSMHSSVKVSHMDLQSVKDELQAIRSDVQRSINNQETDEATGLGNRRQVEHALSRALTRARQFQQKICVGLFEISQYREILAHQGQVAAERLLVHGCELTRAVVREQDQLLRYQDAVFLLIMPETDIGGAQYVLERLKQVFQRTPLHLETHKYNLGLRAGLTLADPADEWRPLLGRVEEALLQLPAGSGQIGVRMR